MLVKIERRLPRCKPLPLDFKFFTAADLKKSDSPISPQESYHFQQLLTTTPFLTDSVLKFFEIFFLF